MFDPERDEDPAPHRFYVRLLVVLVISAVGCLALWPSVSGFSAGPDHDSGCVAILDGWHAQRSAPDMANIVYPAPPSPQQLQDPAVMARWRAEWQASQARPEVQRAIAYLDWKDGAGACITQSRHRLILTGIGLASLAAGIGAVALVLRTRTNLRRSPATAEA